MYYVMLPWKKKYVKENRYKYMTMIGRLGINKCQMWRASSSVYAKRM